MIQDLTREQAFSRQGKIEPPSMLLPASTRLGPYESRRGKHLRDHLFFSGLAILFFFFFFFSSFGVYRVARSYYLAGLFKAPLPNRLLHVHGAVFPLWVLLLITGHPWSPSKASGCASAPRFAGLWFGVLDGGVRRAGRQR